MIFNYMDRSPAYRLLMYIFYVASGNLLFLKGAQRYEFVGSV